MSMTIISMNTIMTTIMMITEDATMNMNMIMNTIMTTIMMITADAAMITTMTTIMSMNTIMITIMMITADVAMTMIIITIMQMKSSQAGAKRHRVSIQRKKLRQFSRHLLLRITSMALSFVQRGCCQARMAHGSTLIWFLKNMKFVEASRNTQVVFV